MTCFVCQKVEIGNICCSNGHYVCDDCHGKDLFKYILSEIEIESSQNAFAIAERLMRNNQVPMLGCENAWIAAGSVLAALRNEGSLGITSEQIHEALHRTKTQAIGGYCGLTGVCGIAPAIGACFSVILDAACPKDEETAKTMRVVGKVVQAIANLTGPCCCKAFVRVGITEAVLAIKEYFNIPLMVPMTIQCDYVTRHPHGCRQEKCLYFRNNGSTLSNIINQDKVIGVSQNVDKT